MGQFLLQILLNAYKLLTRVSHVICYRIFKLTANGSAQASAAKQSRLHLVRLHVHRERVNRQLLRTISSPSVLHQQTPLPHRQCQAGLSALVR